MGNKFIFFPKFMNTYHVKFYGRISKKGDSRTYLLFRYEMLFIMISCIGSSI